MLFFEAFDMLTVDEELRRTFSDVKVEKLRAYKSISQIQVCLKSTVLLHSADKRKMEEQLFRQLFFRTVKKVRLLDSYTLERAVQAEKIWELCRDCVLEELEEEHKFLYFMLKLSKVSFSGEVMELSLEDNFLNKKRELELGSFLIQLFEERFQTQISMKFTYFEAKEDRETVQREDYPMPERPMPKTESTIKSSAPQAARREAVKTEGMKSQDTPKSAYEKGRFYKKKLPDDPDIVFGRPFEGMPITIFEIQEELGEIVIQGKIIKLDIRELKSGKFLILFVITDFTDSITSKIFVKPEQMEDLRGELKEGDFVRIKGMAIFDVYEKEINLGSIQGIKKISDFTKKRMDYSEEKRVELHAHTVMSDMDAVVDAGKLVKTAFSFGFPAIAITDHGVVQSFPEASHVISPKDYKDEDTIERAKAFKVIYGMEAYLVDDEPDYVKNAKGHIFEKGKDGRYSPEDIKKMPYYHAILLCKNDLGRVNLYKMVSLSHLDFFARRPRIPKSLLRENREGLILGSACEAGELFQAVLFERIEDIPRLADFYDYFEIQPTGNNAFMLRQEELLSVRTEEDLKELNRKIVMLGEEYGKPVVATCDVHFLNPEDEVYRRIIMSNKGFKDADMQAPLYLRTTDEMLLEFRYLGEEKAREVVILNTCKVADQIEKISPVRPDKCPPVIEDSDKTLREICYNKAHSMYGDPLPKPVEERLEHELHSIISNGFAVMYIIAQKLVWKSNEDGYLVGSRGSVGSSFVATMAGITEVNPLSAHYYCSNCFYSDFDSEEVSLFVASSGCDMPNKVCPVCGKPLSKDGHNIPFETFLGFHGDKEPDIDLNFSGEYQSRAHDYTEVLFGKGHTYRAGTVGTMAEKTAFGYVYKYYENKGEHKRRAEIERIASGCVGVRRTTGQHPGGIIVLPHGEEIYSFTPVQRPANDVESKVITTHFDYHSIDHNLLKLDILGHDDPTMIRMLEDLTGVDAKQIQMDDPNVISLFESTRALGIQPEDIGGCDLGSLGLPELGTEFVMQMLRDTKPKSFSDMIRISGLSHGTDVWTNNTQTLIAEGKCTLATAICTRDDIMTYLIRMGVESGLAFKIMESVRKGKGLTSEMEEVMLSQDVPDWYIWSCKRIQYMFPKAHACAYVMMAFRIAYFKVYYPLAYYAAFFSIRATAFDYQLMCRGKEVLERYILDFKRRSSELTNKEQDVLRDMKIVQEMYARGFEFLPIDIYRSKARNFQIIDGKLLPSLFAFNGLGDKAADQVEAAAADGAFLSREDFKNRCKVSDVVIEQMHELHLFGDMPKSNQISLVDFFSNE